MVFVYDLQKVLKEKFKCQCSETKLKIPKDASLSAFIRSKNIVQGWGQGMIDAHSRKKKKQKHGGTHNGRRVLCRVFRIKVF